MLLQLCKMCSWRQNLLLFLLLFTNVLLLLPHTQPEIRAGSQLPPRWIRAQPGWRALAALVFTSLHQLSGADWTRVQTCGAFPLHQEPKKCLLILRTGCSHPLLRLGIRVQGLVSCLHLPLFCVSLSRVNATASAVYPSSRTSWSFWGYYKIFIPHLI